VLIATINEVKIGEYELSLPALIRSVEELEDVAAAMIIGASKKVLVVNLEEDLVVEAVAKVVKEGVSAELLVSQGGDTYRSLGLSVAKTNVKTRFVVVDGVKVIFPVSLGPGRLLYIALESREVAEFLSTIIRSGGK